VRQPTGPAPTTAACEWFFIFWGAGRGGEVRSRAEDTGSSKEEERVKNDSSTADKRLLPRASNGKSNLEYSLFLSVHHPGTMAPTAPKKSDPTPATLGRQAGQYGGLQGGGSSSGIKEEFDPEKWELENVHE
jgi:hypothetical protein